MTREGGSVRAQSRQRLTSPCKSTRSTRPCPWLQQLRSRHTATTSAKEALAVGCTASAPKMIDAVNEQVTSVRPRVLRATRAALGTPIAARPGWPKRCTRTRTRGSTTRTALCTAFSERRFTPLPSMKQTTPMVRRRRVLPGPCTRKTDSRSRNPEHTRRGKHEADSSSQVGFLQRRTTERSHTLPHGPRVLLF